MVMMDKMEAETNHLEIPPNSQQCSKDDVQVESNNFVCPGFQRIAEEIKMARAKKTALAKNNEEEEGEDHDDVIYDARPAKLLKLTNIQRDDGHKNGKETEVSQPEKLISYQEFRQQVLKMLKKFFKYAFTIIVEMRRLCPEDAFGATRAFGIEVPKFLHPSSLEYVEEVSRKLVVMMNRTISEGCVLNIMIEKNKTLHVVQRFIFKTRGSLDFVKKIGGDEEEESLVDVLEDVKAKFRASLLQLLNSDEIKPVIAPQYSRWSISVGVTNEFATSASFREFWDNDPNNNHFPWKVKPRSLASASKGNESMKLSAEETNSTGSNTITETSELTSAQQLLPEAVSAINDCEDSAATSHNDKTEEPETRINPSMESAVSGIHNQENLQGPVVAIKPAAGVKPIDESNKIICFPLSSFSITSNLMLSIYGLEYPAPIKRIFNSSVLSPRIGRSPNISYRERLVHLRYKLLRQSSHRPRTS